ncbi:MAG: hypothetical protein JNK57_05260 [Planctomycetaceae bacterium]|nr:hypothetical protein [Planctomycetaceae bacterium]
MLSWLFGKKPNPKVVVCPFCGQDNPLESNQPEVGRTALACSGCGQSIPMRYLQETLRLTNPSQRIWPVTAPIVGFPQSGKSIFIQGLTHVLLESKNPSVLVTACNQESSDFLSEIYSQLNANKPAVPTDWGDEKCYFMRMDQLPLWDSRFVVFRDVPGEAYQDYQIREEQAKFCVSSRCAIFIIYLDQKFEDEKGMKLWWQILEKYETTLIEKGCDIASEGRKGIVVLVQADKLVGLPAHLREYLNNDPIRQKIDGREPRIDMSTNAGMETYLEEMRRASASIRQWVAENRDGGDKLVTRANLMKMQLEFCLISAWGAEPDKTRGEVPPRPMRVLDPLFWLLEFHSKRAN